MSSTDLVVNIIGDAKSAVAAFNEVGDKADKTGSKFTAMKTTVSIASAAIVTGVAKFAMDSVNAYSDAEESQAQLEAAYKKFPAVTSVSIDALRALNTELEHKTGFDDDAFASGQSVLAQFKLTGNQIKQLTPLMADYAAKTGKDLPTAAQDLGKAILGQGKSLKAVGINFTDTKSQAGNFDEIMNGLTGTVQGYATAMGETAKGKTEILNQSFSDLQENIGSMLLPALTDLTDIGSKVTQWLTSNPSVLQAAAIAVGVLTAAIIAANVAMWLMSANPIVLLIMAIVVAVGLLIAGIWLLVANWGAVIGWLTSLWQGFVTWFMGILNGFLGWWNGFWTAIGAFIANIWNNFIVAPIRNAINWLVSAIQRGMNLISSVWSSVWNGLSGVVRGVWEGVIGFIEGGVNGAIDLIDGMIRGVNAISGVMGIHIGLIPKVSLPRLAQGTVTNGPMIAMIGDNPGGREVVQPVSTYQDELRRAYAAGQNGSGGVVLQIINKAGVALSDLIDARIQVNGAWQQLEFSSGEAR